MKVIVVGPSRGLVEAFEAHDVDVATIDGVATRDELTAAGVEDAAAVVITDVEEASAIPVAKKLNEEVRVVIYDYRTMPEFARAQADLAIDPDLLDPGTVVEELVATS